MLANEKSKNKKLENNILDIAFSAKKSLEINKNTINATIGMLFNEKGKLYQYKSVKKALNKLTINEKYEYSNTIGTNEFKTGVLNWVFGSNYDYIIKKFNVGFVPSPGGTGAINNTIFNYLNKGESIILPDIYWEPYSNMCYEYDINISNFCLTKDNKFNFCEFKNLALMHAKTQNKVFFILNDPCHNPTGYTLTNDELEKIFKLQEEIANKNIPFIILYDIAYIDFCNENVFKSRNFLKYIINNNSKNALTILSFSASKTFSLYGLRVGASICINKDKDVIDEFNRVNEYSSRCKWSSINQEGLNLVSKILNNSKLKKSFVIELEKAKNILLKRSVFLTEKLNQNNISYYPFDSGFFITIKSKNPYLLYEKLKVIDIYVIPLKNGIRISISSLKLKEINKLVESVKLLNDY